MNKKELTACADFSRNSSRIIKAIFNDGSVILIKSIVDSPTVNNFGVQLLGEKIDLFK